MIATLLGSINRRTAFALLILPLVALTGCQKSKTSGSTPASKRSKIEACSLITNNEAQEIQGSPIKDAKGSDQSDSSFRVAQCFYTAETFNKSVSLAVTQSDPASAKARNPKDFWKETFGRYVGAVKEHEGDEEKKQSLAEDRKSVV